MDRTGTVRGPQVGELIPGFIARSVSGQPINRHAYRGRRHLVLFFVHSARCDQCRAILDTLAARDQDYRDAGGDVLAILPAAEASALAAVALPYPLIDDVGNDLHGRFGARTATGALLPLLLLTDRYGEVVLRDVPSGERVEPDQERHGLTLDEVLPLLDLLQTRCSL